MFLAEMVPKKQIVYFAVVLLFLHNQEINARSQDLEGKIEHNIFSFS